MPTLGCCFFYASKNAAAITEAWKPEDQISLAIVIAECEKLFDFKSKKLESSDDFALFHRTGFHTIYGITRKKNASDLVEARQLEDLNAFVMAKTIAEKRRLFLTHCNNYMKQCLCLENVEAKMLEAFKGIIDYGAKQMNAGFGAILSQKKSRYKKEPLKAFGAIVTQLLLIQMEVNKSPTNKTLHFQSIEAGLNKLSNILSQGVNNGSNLDAELKTLLSEAEILLKKDSTSTKSSGRQITTLC